MCGIAGFNWNDAGLAERMTAVLAHRGPDDRGHYTDALVSLGHRRLSILDLSEKGKQPMQYGDLRIVFNGEIYNYRELRRRLATESAISHQPSAVSQEEEKAEREAEDGRQKTEDGGQRAEERFESDCDTEVILHAYAKWGAECVNKFNGMWAFCIYDAAGKTLFLSRDRFGVKPLYYYYDGERFCFASELKAVREAGFEEAIDETAVNFFFYQKYIGGERTIFKNFYKLEAGHNLVFDLQSRKLTISKYYDLENEVRACAAMPVEERLKKIEPLIIDAVEKRLIADVPVGSFLSGGIDSSLISAIIAKKHKHFKTFSIGFTEASYDEVPYSKQAAKYIGTEHCVEYIREFQAEERERTSNVQRSTFNVEGKTEDREEEGKKFKSQISNFKNQQAVTEGTESAIRRPLSAISQEEEKTEDGRQKAEDGRWGVDGLVSYVVGAMDEPFGDSSVLPTYLLSQVTRRQVTVSLSGDAGDEVFGGYDSYKAFVVSRWLPGWAIGALKILGRPAGHSEKKVSLGFKIQKFVEDYGERPVRRHLDWMSTFNDGARRELLGERFRGAEELLACSEEESLLSLQLNDIHNYLAEDILKKVDLASMLNSLEVRVPFLDYRLVPLVLSLPDTYKIRGLTTKRLLKDIAGRYLPREIISRRKRGFTVPLAKWLRQSVLMQEVLSQRRYYEHGYINYEYALTLLREHMEGRRDHARKLWLIFVFNYWRDRNG